jgi:hypothetical protein
MTVTSASRIPEVIRLTLAAAIAVTIGSAAAADVVRLKNGQTLEGDATESNGQVSIRSALGTIGVPASLVASIERVPSLERQAAERLAALAPHDLDGRVELALELEDAGASTLAQRILEDVLRRDPDHATARQALGYLSCDGVWLTEEECRLERGEVLYQGRWTSVAERAALEELDHQRRQNELERLRAEIRVESARLEAERLTPSYPSAYYDPYYFGGGYWPGYYWPGVPVVVPPLRPGRPGPGGGDRPGGGRPGGGGGVGAPSGPQHHRGGQPPAPLTPQHNVSRKAGPR